MNSFTEITRRGLFGRLGKSIKGMVFGGLLFLASFPILFINEGCAVKDFKRLAEARDAAVDLTTATVQGDLEGRLVVVRGEATTDEVVRDPRFGVEAEALRLERRAEMYQWEEETETKTRKSAGGGETTEKTYRYKKTWSSQLISSSGFKRSEGHENPSSMPVQSEVFQAARIQLGEFLLSQELANKIHDDEDVALQEEDWKRLAPEDQARFVLHQGELYLGSDPGNPAIGDLRVGFEKVSPRAVTVRAAQQDATFAPWTSSTGGEVYEIRMGMLSAEEMNSRAVKSAKMRTWFVRFGGFFAMGVGLSILVGPLAVVGDVIPLVGSLLRGASGLVAFALAGVLSLIVMAIAWFTYRPLISVPLLVGAVALAWWISRRGSKGFATAPPPMPDTNTPPPMPF